MTGYFKEYQLKIWCLSDELVFEVFVPSFFEFLWFLCIGFIWTGKFYCNDLIVIFQHNVRSGSCLDCHRYQHKVVINHWLLWFSSGYILSILPSCAALRIDLMPVYSYNEYVQLRLRTVTKFTVVVFWYFSSFKICTVC